jgi:6,7-dimethyl-8-ribityllumazine synthase
MTHRLANTRIGIAVSTYNDNITRRLKAGAIETLQAAGIKSEQILVATVPGAWELPLAVQHFLQLPNCSGAIALGAVIRGETTHDRYSNAAVSQALMQLMLQFQRPVGFGLLTCNTMEQAIHRAGGNVGNKGKESAEAVLAMLNLQHSPVA